MPLALHRVKRSVEKWPNRMGMIPEELRMAAPIALISSRG
jgi:hypothetical protein